MSRYDPDDSILSYLSIDRKMALDDQKRPYDGKKACFVPDTKEGFVTAEIISSKGDEITVQTEAGEVSGIMQLYNLIVFSCQLSWPIELSLKVSGHGEITKLLYFLF